MTEFNPVEIKKIYLPQSHSHKGQNGKLLIIGGSHLFHAASLWALMVASRVVDMVFYSSVDENNVLISDLKKEFRNGIIVPRDQIEDYANEADSILIGPGMMRSEAPNTHIPNTLHEINKIRDEGLQSHFLTRYLLQKYPSKKWVIDAGALQMLNPSWLLGLSAGAVLTPHPGEFSRLKSNIADQSLHNQLKDIGIEDQVKIFTREFNCTLLLKGETDIVCSPADCVSVGGGNPGMTKGGTGDVLAGLVGALSCKNDLWLAACAASFFNKKAGDSLFSKVGYYFNSSDLADEIPRIMKEYI